MSPSDLVRLLHAFEESVRVDRIQVRTPYDGKIPGWPPLRLAIPRFLVLDENRSEKNVAGGGVQEGEQFKEEDFSQWREGICQVFSFLSRGRGIPLVATRPEYHQNFSGEVRDKFSSSFARAGVPVSTIVLPGYGKKAHFTSLPNAAGIDAISWLAFNDWLFSDRRLTGRFSGTPARLTGKSVESLRALSEHLAEYSSGRDCDKIESGLQQACVDSAVWIARRTVLYEQILRFVTPPVVFIACWYCPNGMALSRACRKLRIPCIDIQHGIIHPYHIAYAKWLRSPGEGYDLIPPEFWVWDKGAAKIANELESGRSQSEVVGKIWSSPDISDDLGEDTNWAFLKAATRSASRVILVSTQFIEMQGEAIPAAGWQNLPEWLLDEVAQDETIFWLFRAHPRIRNGAAKLHKYLGDRLESENWNVVESSIVPGESVIQLADIHTTYHSSVALEACELGVGTVFFGTNFRDFYEDLLPHEWYREARDRDAFREAVSELSQYSRQESVSSQKSSLAESVRSSRYRSYPVASRLRRVRFHVAQTLKRILPDLSRYPKVSGSHLAEMQIRIFEEKNLPLRVAIGTEPDLNPGWITMSYRDFDATDRASWRRVFSGKPLEGLLAEHVIEHMTTEEFERVLENVGRHMSPDAHFRIAVPDGLHPDPVYIENVRPGGRGPGCDEHRFLYDYRKMKSLVEKSKLHCELLEWWDEYGEFHRKPWGDSDGYIKRSAENDVRNSNGELNYTSLIVDVKRTA